MICQIDEQVHVCSPCPSKQTPDARKYINQQLGSIYERLLELEVIRDGTEIIIRPNVFARKASGCCYTPDDLVKLIIRETLDPRPSAGMEAFSAKARD